MSDFHLNPQGGIFILTPMNELAKSWLREHIPDDAQWFARGVVIEHRYVDGVIAGIAEDGLTHEVV